MSGELRRVRKTVPPLELTARKVIARRVAMELRPDSVNVSRFGPKLAGSGGFINISQNAKRLVFTGTFVVPSRCRVQDGRLIIADRAVAPKFLADVEQRTFSGPYAAAAGQPLLYVTERCVFQLTPSRS